MRVIRLRNKISILTFTKKGVVALLRQDKTDWQPGEEVYVAYAKNKIKSSIVEITRKPTIDDLKGQLIHSGYEDVLHWYRTTAHSIRSCQLVVVKSNRPISRGRWIIRKNEVVHSIHGTGRIVSSERHMLGTWLECQFGSEPFTRYLCVWHEKDREE